MKTTPFVDKLVEQFDHHDPRLGEITHEVYAAMRERCPVAHSDRHGGFWTISSYELVHYALQHYELFTTHPTVNIPAGLGHRRPMLPLEVDPPLHAKYRIVLEPLFAPRRMTALEPKIRALCDSLIDRFIERGGCDFIADLAAPLPTQIFTEMMGLPAGEAGRFLAWKDELIHGHADDPQGTRRAAAGAAVAEYLQALIAERKGERRDDIVSVLLDAEHEGQKLTDEEMLDLAYMLFLAGLDTVTSSLALQFLYLAQHPEQRDRLVADPSIIPYAVEELLRYEPLILAGRTVTRDLEIGGVEMKAGDRVLLNTVSAGRDENQFPKPDEVILDRRPNRHISFAVGPHRCVGSHLARLELRIVHEHVHRRIPTYRLREGAVIHRHASSVAGIDSLPLVWDR